jgi:hypothetical protein
MEPVKGLAKVERDLQIKRVLELLTAQRQALLEEVERTVIGGDELLNEAFGFDLRDTRNQLRAEQRSLIRSMKGEV